MNTALLLLILLMVWLFSLAVSFVAGFMCWRIKKRTSNTKPLTEQEKREIERNQREYENFMTYSGKPQNAIDG